MAGMSDSVPIRFPYRNLNKELEVEMTDDPHFRIDLNSSPNSPSASSSSPSSRVPNGNANLSSPIHAGSKDFSFITLVLSCTVAAGVQFGWALQLSLLTPYIQTLGIEHAFSSFIWLCGPITGLVVQPCVGIWSDKCTSKYGRRRPFILAGALMISLAVIIIGFSADIGYLLGDTKEHCSTFKGTRTRAAFVFVIGFWMLDLANNTVQGPARALLADLSGPDQHNSSNAIFCSWMAVGNILGFSAGVTREIPETANLQLPCEQKPCSKPSKSQRGPILVALIVVIVALSVIGLVTFMQYHRQQQKLSSLSEVPENRLSTDQTKEFSRKNGSPLISLEYANGWDPLADGRNYNGFAESFRFNLEEVETATQYFSELNLLGKSNFSATYRGFLRDGSAIAIKSIGKTSCKSDDAEFLKGLNVLASLKHENLVGLRGFCCSKAQGECFLIYDFVPNGNLLSYLDVKDGNGQVLEWSTRVSIVKGIAKAIAYLHGNEVNKPALVHQNISAQKVVIDDQFNPLLSDSGLHNLLTNDIVFATLKGSAAMGYLAPEYTSTGRFTEKSDVYAFGVVVFQVLGGKRNVTRLVRVGGECCRIQDFIDSNLHGRYLEYEAAKLARIAWHCTHECPVERPSMEAVVQDLGV